MRIAKEETILPSGECDNTAIHFMVHDGSMPNAPQPGDATGVRSEPPCQARWVEKWNIL
ncbi:MAG: hypothetical protein KDF59_15885 [Nitrosomonas sp.]|nr:hypothetical protein [Nitrosomonas sp.]